MAQYKVPQDVEAEDKLIGPFSFRQFIYLGVAALGIGAGVGLWQLFPGLIILPMPIVILFLALALPLRKDQPMETYLVAVIRYFLKPRKRLWQPEGSIGLVTIVASKVVEGPLMKSVGGSAAAAQLDYLSQVVDTQGWASRGVINPTISMNDIAYAEAQQAEDILDDNADVSRTFDTMIDKSSDEHRQTVMEQFQQAARQPAAVPPAPDPQDQTTPQIGNHAQLQDEPMDDQGVADDTPAHFTYNPYPSSMHQRILRPLDDEYDPTVHVDTSKALPQPVQQQPADKTIKNTAADTIPEQVSPDIMRLASNNDLSISAIANEAHRIQDRDNEEVVINLH